MRDTPGPEAPLILLAEDDADMRSLLAEALRRSGCAVTECRDGVEFLARLKPDLDSVTAIRYDLIVSDIRMPGLTGMDVLEAVARAVSRPPIILITAFGDPETHRWAHEMGVAAVFDKPFEIDDLLAAVRGALG